MVNASRQADTVLPFLAMDIATYINNLSFYHDVI
jgi:hypothetical protein